MISMYDKFIYIYIVDYYGFHVGNYTRQPWILWGPFSAAHVMFVVMCNSCRSRRGSSWDNSNTKSFCKAYFVRATIQKGFSMAQIMVRLICFEYVSNGHLLHFLNQFNEDLSFRGVVTGCPFLMRHRPCQI